MNSHPSSFSLRRRLLILLLSTMTLAWAATAVFSYFDARHEIGEMLDAQLAQSARILLAQASHELGEISIDTAGLGHKYERRAAFQIWDWRGNLMLRSGGAPAAPMSQQDEGFSDNIVDGQKWRVFSRRDAGRKLRIIVGERYKLRDELAESVAAHLMHPLLLALPGLAVLIWLGVGRGLAPLRQVADEVQQRAPDRLEPLDTRLAPREVLPLTNALNTLFVRLQQAFDHERRFTADTAHELRTPLAALKTQAQVALGANMEAEKQRALHQVIEGVDRATHLVEQLLTLARLDPQARLVQSTKTDLRAVVANSLANLAPRAIEKKVEVSLAEGGPLEVAGDVTMLQILVRNLVDNAIRYSPANASIDVSVSREGGQVLLRVDDSGPGIPKEERERVFERFYRMLGTGEAGSGLGLSIVKRIAELHGATLRLAEGRNGRGLSIQVNFPAVA